jgi:small subunit ribosomal protein S16
MLRIRLRRVGKRGHPSYRIVVADVRAPRDGAYLEWIGNYDPMADPPAVTIKRDRAEEWLSKGAQPSDAVKRILQWQDILEREPINRNLQTRNPQEAPAAPPPAPAPAVTAVAEAPPAAESEPPPEDSPEQAPSSPDEETSGGDEETDEATNE